MKSIAPPFYGYGYGLGYSFEYKSPITIGGWPLLHRGAFCGLRQLRNCVLQLRCASSDLFRALQMRLRAHSQN